MRNDYETLELTRHDDHNLLEDDIERIWRETRIYQTAPISTSQILPCVGRHVLGLPHFHSY